MAAQLILREGEQPLPVEKDDLRLEVEERVNTLPLVYDPLQKRRSLLVDVNGLRSAMGGPGLATNLLQRCWLGKLALRGGGPREPLIPYTT